MRTIISAAVSRDGFLDDSPPGRLVLSSPEDWEEVYRLRASCDAILVGAETVRRDDPALIIRDARLREERIRRGMPADITKITVTSQGNLDTGARFFTEGPDAPGIVFIREDAPQENIARISDVAQVVAMPEITARGIVDELGRRGMRRLMVEGGARIIRMFMDEDAADEFRLAVAPFDVDDRDAPRLPYFGNLPFEGRAAKTEHMAGETTVYEYVIHEKNMQETDREYLQRAIDISRQCAPCSTAYCVGAVIVAIDGRVFEGCTHETGPHDHAEEEAIKKALDAEAALPGATIYTSMEPCSMRASKPVSCTELILRHGIRKAVYAYAEPAHFVRCEATRLLREAGVEVIVMDELAPQVEEINRHILRESK